MTQLSRYVSGRVLSTILAKRYIKKDTKHWEMLMLASTLMILLSVLVIESLNFRRNGP